jgi:hypothetical protein
MSWDTVAMLHSRVSVGSTASQRLADTIRVHLDRARRSKEAAEIERIASRVPTPSFFVIGIALGVALAMSVVTLLPRSASAAQRPQPAIAVVDGARVLVIDRPIERPRAPAPSIRSRPIVHRARRAPVRADAIMSAAL